MAELVQVKAEYPALAKEAGFRLVRPAGPAI